MKDIYYVFLCSTDPSDEADSALTEEHLKYKDTTVKNIMSFVEDDLDEYQRKYATSEI